MAWRAKSRTLTDHEQIRNWAEERGARPSAVRKTHSGDNTGIIRLDFPGYSGENSLEEISWDEWFEDFEDRNLALIVQDETANGEQSNFNKLVSRDTIESESEGASSKKTRRTASGGSSSRSAPRTTKKSSARDSSAKTSSGSRSSASKSRQGRKTAERGSGSRRKAA